MSKLLCVCPGRDEGEPCRRLRQLKSRSKLFSNDERIRPHPLSAVQRRQRQEYQAYESRVYNLTLDINELRQQIQHGECFKGDVLKLVWTLLDGLRSGAIGLTPSARGFFTSRSHISQDDPEASGGVHQYVMQQVVAAYQPILHHYINSDPGNGEQHNAGHAYCSVSAVLSDGVLVSRMIGQQIKFSSRLLLFFNNQRRLMQQVAQADLVAALSALRLE
ncbi:hypothetical protein GQ600_13993 [Phytophthora cactorum]|nr:hypothetical protein GQ600_13993 [Phytophthora cactorum]